MPPRPHLGSACLVALAVTLATAMAGCAHENDGRDVTRSSSDPAQYVALGDSYTSGQAVPYVVDVACNRSNRNYPSLVADDLNLALDDVSCGGATTGALAAAHQTATDARPPQLDALTPETELVTLGIGANDENLFVVLTEACLGVAAPTSSLCPDLESPDAAENLSATVDVIREHVITALGEVKRRAPNADVVLVGYPQVVPVRIRCTELPASSRVYEYLHQVFVDLDEALQDAAALTGVRYVDVLDPSEGHDVCAGDDAWIQGAVEDPTRPAGGMHPFPEEHRAVADLVLAAIEQ